MISLRKFKNPSHPPFFMVYRICITLIINLKRNMNTQSRCHNSLFEFLYRLDFFGTIIVLHLLFILIDITLIYNMGYYLLYRTSHFCQLHSLYFTSNAGERTSGTFGEGKSCYAQDIGLMGDRQGKELKLT